MAEGTLLNHRGANDVTREELVAYQTPEPTETWFPIAHSQVLDAVSDTLGGAGFQIQRTRLSVAQDGHRFFGVLDLATSVTDGITLSVECVTPQTNLFPSAFVAGPEFSFVTT